MSFNPTTDTSGRIKLRLDYRSRFFSDAAATTPAAVGDGVRSFIDSTGTYTATLVSGSTPPVLTLANGKKTLVAPSGWFAFNLGQPAGLVSVLNNALATLAGQSGTDYLTVMCGAAITGDTILLSKSSGSQFFEMFTGSDGYPQLGSGGTPIDHFDRRPFDGATVRNYGMSVYPMAAGNGSKWIRFFCDGAGSKANTSSIIAQDTSSDIYLGTISNAPGIDPFAGILDYFLILAPNLTAAEYYECSESYRSAYGRADPRAAASYNVAMLINSFGENDVLPEAIAANLSLPAAAVFNCGYEGATTEQLVTAVYPGEYSDLLTALAGKTTVAYFREGSNSLFIDTGAQLAAALQAGWEAIRADHPAVSVVVPTILPRGTGTPTPTDGVRDAANPAIIAAASGVSGVYIADDAADPTIGPDGASNNTTYYGDNTHPSAAGCAIIAGIDGPVIATASAFSSGPPAATPTFSPAAGTYATAQNVTLACTTPGATIHYETNGATPTDASPTYTAAIGLTAGDSVTIKALASASGFADSAVGSASYVIESRAATPTFSPGAGSYTAAQTVTIGSSTSGATIRYTTDGSTPTSGSTPYTGAVPVASSMTLGAIAQASGYADSDVGTAVFSITTPALQVLSPSHAAPGSTGNAVELRGLATAWSSTDPTFEASSGTITGQVLNSDTSATLTFDAPASPGLVTFTDPTTDTSATMGVYATSRRTPASMWFPGLMRRR